jgi:hypothetical protein
LKRTEAVSDELTASLNSPYSGGLAAMIPADDQNGHTKQLTSDEIADDRKAWRCGVPLSIIARRRDIDEQEHRRQLGLPESVLIGLREVRQMREKRRQLEAVRQIIADRENRTDG